MINSSFYLGVLILLEHSCLTTVLNHVEARLSVGRASVCLPSFFHYLSLASLSPVKSRQRSDFTIRNSQSGTELKGKRDRAKSTAEIMRACLTFSVSRAAAAALLLSAGTLFTCCSSVVGEAGRPPRSCRSACVVLQPLSLPRWTMFAL